MNKSLNCLYICALSLGICSLSAQTAPATTPPPTPAASGTAATPTPSGAATTPAAPGAPAAAAAPAAAPTSPVSTPSMEGPLTVNLKPASFDIPDFGKIYVSGAVTAIALADTPPFFGEKTAIADMS